MSSLNVLSLLYLQTWRRTGELARIGVRFSCMSSKVLVLSRGRGWGETPVLCLVAHPPCAVAAVVAISCILHAARKPLLV